MLKHRKTSSRFWISILVVIFIALIILPVYWQIVTSFKNPQEINKTPPDLFPRSFTLENYRLVFTQYNFGIYLKNSFIVAIITTICTLVVAFPAGYGFARYRFKGRVFFKNFILLVSMFPLIAMVMPLFSTFRRLGLINTYAGIIIPTIVVTLPLAIWTLTAFIRNLSFELEEAAMVDGCNRLGAVIHVVCPLLGPGVFSTGIIAFITAWNEFMFAFLFATRLEKRTIPVGIAMFAGEYTFPWAEMTAASIVAAVPIVIAVIICQKHIVSGLTAGALKG